MNYFCNFSLKVTTPHSVIVYNHVPWKITKLSYLYQLLVFIFIEYHDNFM